MSAKTTPGARNSRVMAGRHLLLVFLAICVLGYAGYYYGLAETSQKKAPKPTDTAAHPAETLEIQNPAPHWWESRREIYFNIPARIRLHLPGAGEETARRLTAAAWIEFDRIGRIFNPFDPESETSRLNRQRPTEWTNVSEDLYQVLQTAKKLWNLSDGRFDPTFLPVKRLWQEAEKAQEIPSRRRIKKLLYATGLDQVALRSEPEKQLRLKARGVEFDFGGIAKGHAVDCVRRLLIRRGAADGLVQLGGEVSAFGENFKGRTEGIWRIGVQHPVDMAAVWGVLESASGIRVSTSGNYRQPLVICGHRFYHIFSPKTGQPVSEKVLGVTTASFDNSYANALLDGAATAITVMGAAEGKKLAENLGIEALILTRAENGDIRETMTAGLGKWYEPSAKN